MSDRLADGRANSNFVFPFSKDSAKTPVMFAQLPDTARDAFQWPWTAFAVHFDDLLTRSLDAGSVEKWLADWTRLGCLLSEVRNRLEVETTLNTADKEAEAAFNRFLEEIDQPAKAADQRLKERLLKSELQPPGYAIALRNLRSEAELFREENLPLFTEEKKLGQEYDRIIGAQTVQWEGQERTPAQMQAVLQERDRARRERAWRLVSERQLASRDAINRNWSRLLTLRLRLAANAGFASYLDFRWKQLQRFDYTPEDCRRFHDAIGQVVVPAANRIRERRREKLGIESLRPWDLSVDVGGRPPLKPFGEVSGLIEGGQRIFDQLDPDLAANFATMRTGGLLDLANRKNKAPGGYCTDFELAGVPFVFMNAVGLQGDVQTLLHECGHAFHTFAASRLPFLHQRAVPIEFAEVASMSMELLAAPLLDRRHGGYYDERDAARARIEHLEGIILFWPFMAVVDAFQHWVYTHHNEALEPVACDAAWLDLCERFMPGVDWSGFEEARATGWQRKLHIHTHPLYYVEYGLAQLGAIQVWRNSIEDPTGALSRYRSALALGGTVALPQLFEAAGARLAFDAETLAQAVELGERKIGELTGRAA